MPRGYKGKTILTLTYTAGQKMPAAPFLGNIRLRDPNPPRCSRCSRHSRDLVIQDGLLVHRYPCT